MFTPAQLMGAIVAISGMIVIGLYLLRTSDREFRDVHVEPGTEIFAVDSNLIIQLVYESPTLRLVATRHKEETKKFLIHTEYKSSGLIQDCSSGFAFEEIVKQFSSLRARRSFRSNEMNRVFAEFPVGLGTLTLKDSTTIEPASWNFRATSDHSRIVALDGFQAFEIELTQEIFKLINDGCASFQGRRTPDNRHLLVRYARNEFKGHVESVI